MRFLINGDRGLFFISFLHQGELRQLNSRKFAPKTWDEVFHLRSKLASWHLLKSQA